MKLAMKLCARCGRRLPMDDFGNDAKAPLGKKADCRECRSRSHRSYISTPEGRRAQNEANVRHRDNPDSFMKGIIFAALKAQYGVTRHEINLRLLRPWEQPRYLSVQGRLRPVVAVWTWKGRDDEEFVVHL